MQTRPQRGCSFIMHKVYDMPFHTQGNIGYYVHMGMGTLLQLSGRTCPRLKGGGIVNHTELKRHRL